jgi:hypothetical protein
MSELKEYIVTLHRHEDLDAFYQDMETEGGDLYIPNRAVDLVNRRPISRNTHYWLTDQEAEQLKLDPRVWDVSLTAKALGIVPEPTWSRTANFSKADGYGSAFPNDKNWGVYRTLLGSKIAGWAPTGVYPWADSPPRTQTATINYNLSGKNVDIVIVDGLVKADHPEFKTNPDGTGTSRVNQFNWYSLNPTVRGTAAGVYDYTDTSGYMGHGTHVAGIAGGNTHSLAIDANIYSQGAFGDGGAGGIGTEYFYDYIRAWHNSKSVNPDTGVKNPTVVNNSYGTSYNISVALLNAANATVTHRGTVYNGPWTATGNGTKTWVELGFNYPAIAIIPPYGPNDIGIKVFTSIVAFQADLSDAIADGIHISFAAANDGRRTDVPGGPDFDNKVTFAGNDFYINRSPWFGPLTGNLPYIFNVGNISPHREAPEQGSQKGPGVNIWAPGSGIVSSTHRLGDVADPRGGTDNTVSSYSGTSMASPQVVSLVATLLELNPTITPAAMYSYVRSIAKTGLIDQSGATTNSYDDYGSLQGSANLSLYASNPTFNITASAASLTAGGTVTYTITTTNVPNGSVVYLTESGTSISTDFVDGVTQKVLTVTNNTATWTRTVASRAASTRTSALQLRTGGYNGNIQTTATTVSVTINVTITPMSDLTYSISSYISKSPTSLDDVNSLTASDLSADGLAWSGSATQVTVTDYGATGNGSTNDTSAIVNAIAATPSGATLYFPQGTYMVSSTITVPGNIRLLGPYLGRSTIKLTSGFPAVDPMFASPFNGVAGTYLSSNIRFENLVFDGNNNSSRSDASGGYLLRLIQVNTLKIIKCSFINNTFTAVGLAGNSGVDIWGSKFANCGIIPPTTISSAALFVGGSGNTAGANTNVNVNKCVFRNNKWSGIYFFPTGGSVKNSLFVNNGESSIFGNDTLANATIENNYFYGATRTNISASGLELGGTNLTIRNNFFRNSGSDGLSLANVKTALVENNTSYDNGQELSYPSFANSTGFGVTALNNDRSNNITFRYNRGYNSTGSSPQVYGLSFYKNTDPQVETSTFNNNNFYNNSTSSIGNLNNNSYNPSTVTFSGNLSNSSENYLTGASVVSVVDNFVRSLAVVTITTTEVPYGNNFLQRVDLLVPSGVIKGVVVWIHGGAWSGGAKSATGFTSNQAAFTNNETDSPAVTIRKVAEAGYVVVNCAYRLTSPSSYGYGGDTTGGYPNAITDIETILRYCMVNGAGATVSASWQTIFSYVANYGLLVSGSSAGGHLAVQAVGKYGTSSGKWPTAVLNICGPMDVVYNNTDVVISPALQTAVNIFSNPSDQTGSTKNTTNLIAASPRYQYLYNGTQGPWYTPLNSSRCKFYFVQNTNDTLVTSAMVTPFISSLPSSRVSATTVTEGTVTPGVLDHNFTTASSTFVINVAAAELPAASDFSSFIISFVGVTNQPASNYGIYEGQYTATFTLTTTGVSDGVDIYWTTLPILGTLTASDFTDNTLTGTARIIGNTAIITRSARADLTTEGSEFFKLEIRYPTVNDPVVTISTSSNTDGSIGIIDNSITPVIATYISFIAVTDAAGLDWYIAEGQYTATFTLITSGIPNGTLLYWTTVAPVDYNVNASDFTDNQIQGTVTVQNNRAVITRSARADLTTEGSELFQLEIRETSYTSTPVITSTTSTYGYVGIGDSSKTPTLSSDATLSSLTISNGTLTPSFGSSTITYTNLVANSVGSVTVTPTRTESNATITVNGIAVTSGSASNAINLNVGSNTITVIVTAQDSTIKTYTITVTRGSPTLSSDATLSALTISNGTLTPSFISSAITYTNLVANSVSSVTVTPTRTESNATITVNGIAVTSGSASNAINLNVGSNTITVIVTAQDGTTTKTYTIAVTRASPTLSSDATLSSLTISNGTLTPSFGSSTITYTNSVVNATSSVTVTPTRTESNATITVNGIAVTSGSASGSISLSVGSNTITVIVTAQDGTTTKTYTIAVTRAASALASYVSFVGVTNSSLDWYISESQYTATFTLTTANIANGTTLYWTTLGVVGTLTADDFTDNTLQGTVTVQNNQAIITRSARADLTTEGSELFQLEIRETSYTSTPVITSTSSSGSGSIAIGDTSTTPVSITYVSLVGVTNYSPSNTTLFEGQYTATFTLTTTNATDGTVVYWTTLGSVGTITADDFTDNTLQGAATITSNTATITRSARADLFTEGAEVFQLEIRETSYTSVVKIMSANIGIADTSTTPIIPTYAVAPPAGVSSVNEGVSLTFTVTTTNVANSTQLNWAVTNAGDFVTSTGTVIINSNTGTFSVTPTADFTTEGTETFTASIYTGTITGTPVATSSAVTINDTSLTPPGTSTYAVAPPAGVTSVNEGTALTFTVTTTNVANATQLNWALSNAGDFATPTGTVTITTTGINGTGTFSVTPTADLTTEGAETFTASIYTGTITGTPVATSSAVTIGDTSLTPIGSVITYVSFSSTGDPALAWESWSSLSPTSTFVLTTANAQDGAVIFWTTNSYLGTGVTADDFADFQNQGTATITGNRATITRTVRADFTTEGFEYYKIEIRETSYTSEVKITSNYVAIVDNSTAITSVSVVPSATSVDEGSPVWFSVTIVQVAEAYTSTPTLYWSLSRPGDFAVSNGSFAVTNNTGIFSVTPTADFTTEGAETFTVSILSSPVNGPVTPIVFVTSDPITINDTSLTCTYSITPVGNTVNEGTAIRFNIATVNVPNGTQLFWSVSNSGDFSTSAGTVVIYSNAGNFLVTPTLDFITEGTETFTASISLTSGGSPVATSGAVTINDILAQPTYALTSATSSVNEGSSLTFNWTTTNVPVGTELFWTVSYPVASVLTPVYILTPAAASVNEGSPLTFTVSGSNIPSGTYYWTVTNSGDFSSSNGSFPIASSTGSFSVTPTADFTTEGAETFTVSVRPGSIAGTPVVTSSPAIIINDTSLTPPGSPTYVVAPPVGVSSVNEGATLVFTVTTTLVSNGTILNWALTNAGDFTTPTGTVTINSNTGTFSVIPTADLTTEGAETFTVSIYTGSITGTPVATSSEVTINDTSTAPLPTYAVAPPPGITSVNEGVSLTFTVTTTNVANATQLNWAVTNAGDFATNTGTVIINTNTGTFSVTPTADLTTEGTETFTVSIYTGTITGTPVATSSAVTINDTSLTPPPTYAVAPPPGVTSVNEGTALIFTVTTTNLPSPTTLYWVLTNAGDFVTSTGNVIINSNTGTFSVTPTADLVTEGAETFTVGIRTSAISVSDVATSSAITINDTSLTPLVPPTYSVAPTTASVNEGVALTFNVTTTNVANGTTLYWAYKDGTAVASDLTVANGSFIINSLGNGGFTVTPVADSTTEGSETFRISILTGSVTGKEEAYSSSVTINDTSLPSATYAVAAAAASVNEGTPLIFTVTTTGLTDNTVIFWSITNAGDFGINSGYIFISNNSGSFSVTPTADLTTEGAETFTASISLTSGGTAVATSGSVTINDTSLTPVNLSLLYGTKITPTSYNSARSQTVAALGTSTTGTLQAVEGYGQTPVSSPVGQYNKVTEVQLDLLRQDITKTYTHQNGAAPTITDVATSDKELAVLFSAYETLAAGIYTNRNTVAANQLATVAYTPQTETYASYTGTAGTGAGWKNYAYYESTITFTSANDARYFFNAGSTYNFTAAHSGGTQSPDLGKSQNKSWDDLLTAVTAANPSFGRSNFYALTDAYNTASPVYIRNSTDTTYAANYYRITAKSNVANNSQGGATSITFKIEFVDAFNEGNLTNYDGVDGTFTSTISRKMPKGPGAGGAVYVAAPTDPVSTPSNGFTESGTPIYITAAYAIAVRAPSTITEQSVTAYFDFTATNYYTGNTITWTITATTTTGLNDFVETGWTAGLTVGGYKTLTRTSVNSGSYANSTSSISIVTNPDRATEGTETFTISAVGSPDGSGGGNKVTAPTPLTVTDSSKTDTPGITVTNTAGTVVGPSTELTCVAGNGNGSEGTWRVTSAALTGGVDLIIYGFYIDTSASDQSFDTWTILPPTGFPNPIITQASGNYTLPTPRTVTNGTNFDLKISVGSSNGQYPRSSTVVLKVVSNAGTIDGSGAATGPTYRITSTTITVQIQTPTVVLTFTASPPSVSFSFVGNSGVQGSGSTTLTLTNTGNSPATLSGFFVGYAGSIQSSAGSMTGTISAGGVGIGYTKTASASYSYYGTDTASGTSAISIIGTHPKIGTVNSSSFGLAVTATKAVPNLIAILSQSSTSTEVGKASSDITITFYNYGNAPLTISSVTGNGGVFITAITRTGPSITSVAANSSASTTYTFTRSNIGTSLTTISIASNDPAGVKTALISVTGVPRVPTFRLLNNGVVTTTGTGWTDGSDAFSIFLSSKGTLKKNSRVRTEISNIEPNAVGGFWLFQTEDQDTVGNGGKGIWAETALYLPRKTDPKLCPVSSFTSDATGFAAPWAGTDPTYGSYETKYWRAGRSRFYGQIPVGKYDGGLQAWYTNSTSGTTAGGSGRWASCTAPESACGSNQIWIGFTVVPDITATWSDLAPVQGSTITVTISGGPSIMQTSTYFTNVTNDTGTYSWSVAGFQPYSSIPPQTYISNGQGELTCTVLANGPVGTYNSLAIIFPSAGDGYLIGVYSNFVTFDVLSPAFYIVDGVAAPEWGVGSVACNATNVAAAPVGTFIYHRRVIAINGTYNNINVYASCDDTLTVYCQGLQVGVGAFYAQGPNLNKTIVVSDGYTHWRFDYTNGGGPGWFGVGVYVGTDLYFALSSIPAAPGMPLRNASKW